MIKITFSERLKNINKYIFDDIYRDKKLLQERNLINFDLGPGSDMIEPPISLKKELSKIVLCKKIHDYSDMDGHYDFLKSIVNFYLDRYDVRIKSLDEIAIFHGSKEGMGKIVYAFSNPGDLVLCPNPAYPIFEQSAILYGNKIEYLPLLLENEFYPDLESISKKSLNRAKILFLNYPNIPTTTNTNPSFYKNVIKIALENNILVVNDATYSNIYFQEAYKPISIFEIEGADNCAIEFNSLSQMFGIAGWRVGFAIGKSKLIKRLMHVEKILDSGVFLGFQKALVMAINNYSEIISQRNEIFEKKKELLISGLQDLNLEIYPSNVTYYTWVKLPYKSKSVDVYNKLLTKASVLTIPGVRFGRYGEGYIRFCFARDDETIANAIKNIKKHYKDIFYK